MRSEPHAFAVVGLLYLVDLIGAEDLWLGRVGNVPSSKRRVGSTDIAAALGPLLLSRHRDLPTADRERHLEERVGRLGMRRVVFMTTESSRFTDIRYVDDRDAGEPKAGIKLVAAAHGVVQGMIAATRMRHLARRYVLARQPPARYFFWA